MTYKIAQTVAVGKKNASQHRKPNTTLNQGLYRSDGNISDIST